MIDEELSWRVRKAVQECSRLDGMRRSFRTILDRQRENADKIPDLASRKERLRRTKETSVGNIELFEQALETLRANGFRVLLAKSASAAARAVAQEVEGQRLVVKSKSNITKEIRLAEALAKEGVEVIETDLGDRIVQLARCAAVHPTGPACHMTRGEIAALISEHLGRRVSDDASELTEAIRAEIASHLSRAEVGITGANAVTALEGAVVIVHNEGNAAKCAMLPAKHIIVTTPEKVVPDLEEAMNVVRLQTYMSTGKIVPSYVNIITGPSYTADIEKKVYRGMHGPKEVVIVFLDDGRLGSQEREAMYCIGCGMCLLHCPVYDIVGPVFGSAGHMGGQGVYLAGALGRPEEAVEAGLMLCTSCGACREVCPVRIDTRKGLIRIRSTPTCREKGMSREHASLLSSLRNYGNPWNIPRRRRAKWSLGLSLPKEGDVVFFAGCSTSLLSPEQARKAVRLIRACGVEPAYLGEDEGCCGSTAWKLGDEELSRSLAEARFRSFRAAGAKLVVTPCPGCSSALRRFADLTGERGIYIQHISEFLASHLGRLALRPLSKGRVTYHDPCDLGREQGVYDQPRQLLSKALAAPLVEMERSKALSACCGAGSGVRTGFPELADEIARARVRMAREVFADVIVTACPWCEQSLRGCQVAEGAVQVSNLIDVLDEALTR